MTRYFKKLYGELGILLLLTWLSDGDPGIPVAIAPEIASKAVDLLSGCQIEKNMQ